jgi:hypothetical protein
VWLSERDAPDTAQFFIQSQIIESKMSNSKMTVADLRKALERFNDNDIVVINVMQENKVYGISQSGLNKNEHFGEDRPWDRFGQVSNLYGGCCITTWLPDGMFTTQRKK